MCECPRHHVPTSLASAHARTRRCHRTAPALRPNYAGRCFVPFSHSVLSNAEMHYDHADMRTWFQQTGAGVTYSDVLTRFTALRQLGLRLHYWP